MIVLIIVVAAAVTVTKVKTAKVMFLVFCSDCNSSNGKVNKREPVYGKL